MNYLSRNVNKTKSTYEKALVAYALSLSEDAMRTVAYGRLKEDARKDRIQGNRYSHCC